MEADKCAFGECALRIQGGTGGKRVGEYNSVKATYIQEEREWMVGAWIDGRVYIEKQSWRKRGKG